MRYPATARPTHQFRKNSNAKTCFMPPAHFLRQHASVDNIWREQAKIAALRTAVAKTNNKNTDLLK